jgi:hypothetical protein
MASDPSTADIISAIAAVVSAAGGCFAAWAAYRSATHARATSVHAQDAERRLAASALLGTAQTVRSDIALAESLVETYLGELTANEVFTGNRGHSRGAEMRAKISAELESLKLIEPQLETIRAGNHSLHTASIADISSHPAQVEEFATRARRVCDDLGRRLGSVTAQNRAYRDAVATRTNPPGA